ncbi:attractin-like [Notothenia coriiceps]|uniref:Attractin-like n=1 Tax=Notothenia coriiceps TaxID=8208 RepID=A0A6I9NQ48_9TELE|nr:PREDICTED: attractin-like [Notothenia coriiceps]
MLAARRTAKYRNLRSVSGQPGAVGATDHKQTRAKRVKLAIEGSPQARLNASACPPTRPNTTGLFIHCPACQCNGHSQCVNESVCEKCEDLTTGRHCESCISGFYGDPTNGGNCQPCKCNGHASMCNPNNGKCFCTTKGIKGDRCHLCEVENRYQGNPLKGTCYCKWNSN